MRRHHRLVGWWLAGGCASVAPSALGQATASFPEEPPRQTAPAPAAAPAPARPAPSPPVRAVPLPPATTPKAPAQPQAPAPAVAPTPVAAPPPLAPVAAAPPPITPQAPAASIPGDPRAPVLPYREGLPVPPGYTVVERPARGLVTAGMVGLGIAYAGALTFGAVEGFKNGTAWLAAPVVGPWGAIGSRTYETCKTSTVELAKKCVSNAVKEVQIVTFLAVDGIGQLAGALVTVAGLASTRQELIRSDLENVQVTFIPPGDRRPWAVSVSGQF